MAIAPIPFQNQQAFSSFDFSPLARLGQIGQQAQRDQMLANLGTAPASSTAPVIDSAASAYTPSTVSRSSYNNQDVARTVTNELKAQGFSDNAIACILYTVGKESAFDPTSRVADQPRYGGEAHYAHGLFQEGGDEYNQMAAHLRNRETPGVWHDPLEQTRFVAGRLKGEIGNAQYADTMKALQNARTPEEAARVFASGYLKPAANQLSARYYDINRGIPGIGFYTGQ
jgi:hypothetical protein